MRLRLNKRDARYLLGALDAWIEGYQDTAWDESIDLEQLKDLMHDQHTAERIRMRLWKKVRRG